MEEKLDKLIEEWESDDGDHLEIVKNINDLLDEAAVQHTVGHSTVFDSPGLEVLVLMVAYIDEDGDLIADYYERHHC